MNLRLEGIGAGEVLSQTVWQTLSRAERDQLLAAPIVPAFLGAIYGAYQFYALGGSLDHFLKTYVMVGGGVLSIAGTLMFGIAAAGNKRGVFPMLGSLAGFLPHFFSMYLILVAGLYGLWQAAVSWSIVGAILAVVWIKLGHVLTKKFVIVCDIAIAPTADIRHE